MPIQEGLFEVAEDYRVPAAALLSPPEGYIPEGITNKQAVFDIVVDQERIDDVLGTLMQQFEARDFPYNLESTRVPHDPRHMPETFVRGDLDKTMFLWTVCYYMRGGIKSVDALKRLTPLYNERPDLFDCDVAAVTPPKEIAQLLTKHGLGFQDTVSNSWVTNARRLHDLWGGDPRNIFDGVATYEESLARIANDGKGGGFKGFKEKMTSMIIYYLMDEELIEQFPFPIPIDLHVMRVSIANELIRFPNVPFGVDLYTPQVTALLRKIYYDYAVSNGINPLRLCDAVWLLSESLCGKHPGNQTLEPHGRKHRQGRNTYLKPVEVDPTNPVQQTAYEASCRSCPIEETCAFTLPGKPYYIGGVLFRRGFRERFPISSQVELFGV